MISKIGPFLSTWVDIWLWGGKFDPPIFRMPQNGAKVVKTGKISQKGENRVFGRKPVCGGANLPPPGPPYSPYEKVLFH